MDYFIEMANAGLIETGLPPSAKTFDEIGHELETSLAAAAFHNPTDANVQQKWLEHIREQNSANALAAERLIGTILYVKGDPGSTLLAYEDARTIRNVLEQICRIAVTPGRTEHAAVELPHVWSSEVAKIDSNGRIAIEARVSRRERLYERFIKALKGVDPTRIRECSCRRIYWAQRANKLFCSDQCRIKAWLTAKPEKWAEIQNRHDKKRPKDRRRRATKAADPDPQRVPVRSRRPRLPGASGQSGPRL